MLEYNRTHYYNVRIIILNRGYIMSTTKNIKVNIPATTDRARTSTTLSYVICDFFFGDIVNPQAKSKLKAAKYRSWLEDKAQKWVNGLEGAVVSNIHLEYKLLGLIRDHSYHQGLTKNKDNLGFDI